VAEQPLDRRAHVPEQAVGPADGDDVRRLLDERPIAALERLALGDVAEQEDGSARRGPRVTVGLVSASRRGDRVGGDGQESGIGPPVDGHPEVVVRLRPVAVGGLPSVAASGRRHEVGHGRRALERLVDPAADRRGGEQPARRPVQVDDAPGGVDDHDAVGEVREHRVASDR